MIGAGGIFTGSNPAYTSLELNHHVKTANAKYVISEPQLISRAKACARECGIPLSRIFVFDAVDKGSLEGLRSWQELLQYGEQDWIRFATLHEQEKTVAAYAFTSGSTGFAKAALITHKYLVFQTWAIESRGKPYEVMFRSLRLRRQIDGMRRSLDFSASLLSMSTGFHSPLAAPCASDIPSI